MSESNERAAAAVYVLDLPRVARFYIEVAGLEQESEGDGFLVLGSAVRELALVQVPAEVASDLVLADPPLRREETPIKLAFDVSDLAVARENAPALGGLVDPAEREWVWQGRTVCDGHDPEGNVIQLRVSSRPTRVEG